MRNTILQVMTKDFLISTGEEIRILTKRIEEYFLKLELLENEVMSMKTENTKLEKERKENTDILKGLEIYNRHDSEFQARVEEIQCRQNEVTSYILNKDHWIEKSNDCTVSKMLFKPTYLKMARLLCSDMLLSVRLTCTTKKNKQTSNLTPVDLIDNVYGWGKSEHAQG